MEETKKTPLDLESIVARQFTKIRLPKVNARPAGDKILILLPSISEYTASGLSKGKSTIEHEKSMLKGGPLLVLKVGIELQENKEIKDCPKPGDYINLMQHGQLNKFEAELLDEYITNIGDIDLIANKMKDEKVDFDIDMLRMSNNRNVGVASIYYSDIAGIINDPIKTHLFNYEVRLMGLKKGFASYGKAKQQEHQDSFLEAISILERNFWTD